jgi:uncharacterized membrane protein
MELNLHGIALQDLIAPLWFAFCWIGYSIVADHLSKSRHSLLIIINNHRINWMRRMLRRDNRMVDSTLVGNLLRSISFFASTTIFIILGLFTMLKYREDASGILTHIPYAEPTTPVLWEEKVFLLIVIFVYTFFKHTWSLRQYNYACVMIGAAPYATENNEYEEYAKSSAALISNASKHFNMGLRAYYFGLAAIAWFLNAWAFMLASAFVVWVLYRREFRSQVLHYMIEAWKAVEK